MIDPQLEKRIGRLRGIVGGGEDPEVTRQLVCHANLKLSQLGLPVFPMESNAELPDPAANSTGSERGKDSRPADHLSPVDQRIQNFLRRYLKDVVEAPRLPSRTFVLDRHGLARLLSLPPDRDEFSSDIINSYRVQIGRAHV